MSNGGNLITRRLLLLGAVIWLPAAAASRAFADDDKGDGKDDGGGGGKGGGSAGGGSSGASGNGGSDDIRAAVKSGEAAPLKDILSVVRQNYPGQVVSIKLGGAANRLVYLIRVIDTSNRLIEIHVNAKSRKIISVAGV